MASKFFGCTTKDSVLYNKRYELVCECYMKILKTYVSYIQNIIFFWDRQRLPCSWYTFYSYSTRISLFISVIKYAFFILSNIPVSGNTSFILPRNPQVPSVHIIFVSLRLNLLIYTLLYLIVKPYIHFWYDFVPGRYIIRLNLNIRNVFYKLPSTSSILLSFSEHTSDSSKLSRNLFLCSSFTFWSFSFCTFNLSNAFSLSGTHFFFHLFITNFNKIV